MAYTTIDDPSAYFQTALYSGDSSSVTVTNDGNSDLQPDWLWFKKRNTTGDHNTFDTSRGLTERLFPNLASASDSGSNGISALTDGFTSGTFYGDVNGAGNTFVTWQWKCNGGTETHSQSESGSNIACSVQANTTAGFSIVTYTGTGTAGHTFLHGLGSAPHLIIIKCRSVGHHWRVYHHKNTSAPQTDALSLNQTDATNDQDYWWDDTAPNSTEIALGNGDSGLNDDGATHVAYCFKEIQGYSKYGTYEGNSNADGTFVYTGFKPAWLMIKNISAAQSWWIFDNKRQGYNGGDVRLRADRNTAEDTGSKVDFVSNCFKWRDGDNAWNYSGNDFIYMAFAESPFVSSKGVPCTAR